MPDEKEMIVVNHLTTKEDFTDFRLAASKAVINHKEVLILNVLGYVMILLGLIGEVLISKVLYTDIIYGLLVLFGLFISFYFNTLHPYFLRTRSVNYFETHRERMIAQTVTFYPEKLEISTDRYKAALPYKMLYQCYEDDKVFLLYTGIGEMRFIPKRAVSQEDCCRIHQILSEQLKEKYKQEGAR
jgi:hypothetical protein